MSEDAIDQEKAEAFAGRMLDILNSGAVALMVSIGHRTRLFDTMAEMPPATSQEIADKAGLQERYVREWLGAMVTGRIVTHDPEAKRYALPREHAAFLTRAAVSDNLAVYAQSVPLLGSVEDEIVVCFEKGGGVPYSSYPRFQEVMAQDSAMTVLPALLEAIVPLAEGVRERLEQGVEVLDVGCGTGRAINLLARTFPRSRFHGYDISENGIAAARAEAAEHGLENVTFEVKDVTHLGDDARFHLITAFDAIHDQAQPDTVLRGICKALHPEGAFIMQDIRASSHLHENMEHPVGPLFYTISCMHCMAVSLAAGGPGLGTMWGRELAQQMLREAGFTRVALEELSHDIMNDYYVCRR